MILKFMYGLSVASKQRRHGDGNVGCGIHAMRPFYMARPKIKRLFVSLGNQFYISLLIMIDQYFFDTGKSPNTKNVMFVMNKLELQKLLLKL